MRLLRHLETVAVVAAVLVGVLLAAVTVVTLVAVHDGYQAIAMQTGSMAPAINPGDLVVIQQVAPQQITTGDVITFQAPVDGSPMVTHRVIAVRESASGPVFQTKGDQNQSPDPWSIHYNAGGWRLTRVVPSGAAVLDFLRGGLGHVVTGVLTFVVVLAILAAPSRRTGRAAEVSAA